MKLWFGPTARTVDNNNNNNNNNNNKTVNAFPTQGFADLRASTWGSDVRATGIASI
jgi:hypothetical protein